MNLKGEKTCCDCIYYQATNGIFGKCRHPKNKRFELHWFDKPCRRFDDDATEKLPPKMCVSCKEQCFAFDEDKECDTGEFVPDFDFVWEAQDCGLWAN